MLGRLDCDLSVAYSLEFLRRFSRVAEETIDPREYTLSKVSFSNSLPFDNAHI